MNNKIKGKRFEKEIIEYLKKQNFQVISKGKGIDLIAIRDNSFYVIEAKSLKRKIKGKTLNNYLNNLSKESKKLLQDEYYKELSKNKVVLKFLISENSIKKKYVYDNKYIMNFEAFKDFVTSR